MRVEAAPYVFRNADRRQRFDDRRTYASERRSETAQVTGPRARHAAHVWFAPAFGAHILGQVSPERANASRVALAYAQPEARTPLRPSLAKSA
jgi:hypothetical protein